MSLRQWLDPLGLFGSGTDVEKQSVTAPNSAEEGAMIGVLWGTRDIESMNYTYFGDVKQVAIKTKSGK